MRGRVSQFDAERGLGEVAGDDGGVWPFHCVEIADGSRRIDVGSSVTFELRRKLGRFEAAAVTPAAQLFDDVDTRCVDIV